MELFEGNVYIGYMPHISQELTEYKVALKTNKAYLLVGEIYGRSVWVAKGAVQSAEKGFKMSHTQSAEYGDIVVNQSTNIQGVFAVVEDVTDFMNKNEDIKEEDVSVVDKSPLPLKIEKE